MTDQLPATQTERRVSHREVPMDRTIGGGQLAPTNLGEVMAFAEVMCKADIALPKHLRGNAGACLAVTLQAARWGMDPFAVANKSYSVNDRMGYEAQLIAAVVHSLAPIESRPRYEFTGEGPTLQCRIVCVMEGGEERDYISPRFDRITTKNSPLWKTDPEQQLGYYSIRAWARRHTPEVILGLYTPDEVRDIREEPETSGVAGRLTGRGDTGLTDTVMAEIEVHAAAVRGKRKPKDEPAEAAPKSAEIAPEVIETVDPQGVVGGAETVNEDPDEWTFLENHEGPAPTGIVYLLAGDEIMAGRVPTYQDGERFSTVTQKGAAQLPQYTEHPTPEQMAPAEGPSEVEATDAPETIEEAATEIESEPQGGFLADMLAADSWLVIKRQTGELSQTPEWKAASEDDRDDMRRAIVAAVYALKARKPEEPVEPTNDPTFFRLWLATQNAETADTIEANLRSLKKTTGWAKLSEANQETLVALAAQQAKKAAA